MSISASARAPRLSAMVARPVLVIGLAIVVFWIFVALTIDAWSVYEPLKIVARKLQEPSWQHWLGTDALGRDVLTRTLYGARYSIAMSVSVVVGSTLGAIAGFFGGWVDSVVMRLVDVTLAFPPVLLAMAVAASLGPGL